MSDITRDVKLNASPVRIALKSIEIYLLALNLAFTILSVKILSVNLSPAFTSLNKYTVTI